ncbi:hypothetical protein EDB89DRAFT_2241827 [Lactarius sanguifluus]|nr:hypothetical protein EDB89DRAFT_2241827 [Lactarius sanguifluus]
MRSRRLAVIGWKAEGLEAYASFIMDLVVPDSTVLLSDICTSYYGSGKMAGVVARLLQECDRVCNGLIEVVACRCGKRKFPVDRAITDHTAASDDVNPRDIDKVISEAAGMAGRVIERKRGKTNTFAHLITAQGPSKLASPGTNLKPPDDSPHSTSEELKAVESSAYNRLIEDFLSTYYIPLEVAERHRQSPLYTASAHRLSTPDVSSSPTMTTTTNDAFYIFKDVLSRLLPTGAPRVVERTSGALRSVIENDYAGTIRRKMDNILLDDLDMSASHMDCLVKDLLAAAVIPQSFLAEEVNAARASISSFSSIVPKFQSILRVGVERLFNQLLRPKLAHIAGPSRSRAVRSWQIDCWTELSLGTVATKLG